MQLETQEEKDLWKAVVIAVLNTETYGVDKAYPTADHVVNEFRQRVYKEPVDTGI